VAATRQTEEKREKPKPEEQEGMPQRQHCPPERRWAVQNYSSYPHNELKSGCVRCPSRVRSLIVHRRVRAFGSRRTVKTACLAPTPSCVKLETVVSCVERTLMPLHGSRRSFRWSRSCEAAEVPGEGETVITSGNNKQ
jgi:hypothetical protein